MAGGVVAGGVVGAATAGVPDAAPGALSGEAGCGPVAGAGATAEGAANLSSTDFGVADRMITNFHMPESTLLMMVAAFGGYDHVWNAYKVAIKEKYRFFSYGDAMLII